MAGSQEPDRAPLPVGTQVVMVARGRLGVVTGVTPGSPAHYRVRFPDGSERTLPAKELVTQSAWQVTGRPEADDEDLRRYVIYRCVVGSRAFGLDQDDSDTDRRGIYLPPAERQWSLAGVPNLLEDEATQEVYWELERFLTFALKANPNILECLYTPLVEHAAPLAQELLAMRRAFLSRLIYQTYNGYVMSQFRKMAQDLRTHGAIRPKHAMHLIRLLLSGIAALREGEIRLRLDEHREALLAIRHEQMPWDEVDAWRLRLHQEFDAAYETTRLPELPDYAQADAFLLRARRSMVG